MTICFLFLVARCGVLTVEIEHVDAETLERLERQGIDCQPKASTIRIIQVCLISSNSNGDSFVLVYDSV